MCKDGDDQAERPAGIAGALRGALEVHQTPAPRDERDQDQPPQRRQRPPSLCARSTPRGAGAIVATELSRPYHGSDDGRPAARRAATPASISPDRSPERSESAIGRSCSPVVRVGPRIRLVSRVSPRQSPRRRSRPTPPAEPPPRSRVGRSSRTHPSAQPIVPRTPSSPRIHAAWTAVLIVAPHRRRRRSTRSPPVANERHQDVHAGEHVPAALPGCFERLAAPTVIGHPRDPLQEQRDQGAASCSRRFPQDRVTPFDSASKTPSPLLCVVLLSRQLSARARNRLHPEIGALRERLPTSP